MPNIATILKEEIRRLAKKEIKAATGTTKQAVAQYRRDIATLKRLLHGQQREIAFLKGQEKKRLARPRPADEPLDGSRFSARSVKAQRRRLMLSAADFGKLLGVSGLTIYNWEAGKSRAGESNLAALVAVRKLGKREALAKLEVLGAEAKKVKGLRRKKPR